MRLRVGEDAVLGGRDSERGRMPADGAETSFPSSAILTFLVADIRGYTAFTRGRGDEAAARLASVFAQIVGEGVEAYGGRLVELRGDEALVIFASARQALRAAAELQSAFGDETDPDLPLRVGIGVDSGEAVPVGDGYRGAALNFAARLCSIAGPGEVRASASLVHLAGQVDGLRYDAVEPATFKGYSDPVAVFGIVSTAALAPPAADAASPAVAAPAVAPPLPPELDPIVPIAGREAELRWLRWHWRRARHGHSRTVVLSGPPGIGKTRLAAEIAGVAHEDGATIRYLPAARLAADLPGLASELASGGRCSPSWTTSTPPRSMPGVASSSTRAASPAGPGCCSSPTGSRPRRSWSRSRSAWRPASSG